MLEQFCVFAISIPLQGSLFSSVVNWQANMSGSVKQRGRRARNEAREANNSSDRKETAKRQLERGREMLNKTKTRVQRIIKITLVTAGIGVFALAVIAMVLLERVESCRWPRHEMCEDFTYTIDLEYPLATTDPAGTYRGGKLLGMTGGQIDTLSFQQDYGTYKIIADENMETSDVRMRVCNRAVDQWYLARTTYLTAEAVQVTKQNKTSWMTNVYLKSHTSGTYGGDIPCVRADVEVYIPVKCLLDDTKLKVEITKGHIFVDNMTSTIDVITLHNDAGKIDVNQLYGNRIELNTSTGVIQSNLVSAHFLFMQGRASGSTVEASNTSLYSSDKADSCTTTFYYREGFPEEPAYMIEEVVCDQEPGKLTIDTRGEEGEIVRLDRVEGGNIEHANKFGETNVDIMACYDFAGRYDIISNLVTMQMAVSEEDLATSRNSLAGSNEPTVVRYYAHDFGYPRYEAANAGFRYVGEICGNASGLYNMPEGFVPPNLTMTLETLLTASGARGGPITVTIHPPFVDEKSSAQRLFLNFAVLTIATLLYLVG